MTTIDTPRTYRFPGTWGWFFLLSETDREDVCFGHDPDVRAELERLEVKQYAGLDYPRDPARVKELEEILESAA